MNRSALILIASIGVAAGCWFAQPAARSGEAPVRPPAVAGQFYPADAAALQRAVDTLVSHARPPLAGDVVAVVAPHAGYVFSGQIAADALTYLRAVRPEVVVVLGANHTAPAVRGVAVYAGTSFRTPLGEIAIDREVTDALLESGPGVSADAAPHASEHSIEVQLPFVQVLAPRARMVAAIVGTQDPSETGRFGRALATAVKGRRALVVASSDLSHYPSAQDASAMDRRTLDEIAHMDASALVAWAHDAVAARTPQVVTAACGLGPVLAAIGAARALGATQATVVSYANSGDVATGDADRVVGYGAVIFHRDAARATAPPAREAPRPAAATAPLSPPERQALLHLARATFAQFLQSEALPLPRDLPASLDARRQGAFVTLRAGGQLRGCIGRVEGDGPLPALVSRVAFDAAFRDTRFPPVRREELDQLEVEVSLLTPPRTIATPAEVVVGRDGVILRKAGRSAVFLPQVATEQGWTRRQLLDRLCEKAGLAAACWHEGASLLTFQAEAFGEHASR